jgi:K+-transporting ATPase ATPase A chain
MVIFSIGAALTNVFSRMVRNQRKTWALFGVMGLLWLVGVIVA